MRRPTILPMLLVLVLAACAPATGARSTNTPLIESPATTSTSSVTSSGTSASSAQGIPDGTYARTATPEDLKALGVSLKQYRKVGGRFGRDGAVTFVLKFLGDNWTQFEVVDGRPPRGEDQGKLEYDSDRRVVLTSDGDGCFCNSYTYEWTVSGDQLTTRMVSHDTNETPVQLHIVRFVTEGTWKLQA